MASISSSSLQRLSKPGMGPTSSYFHTQTSVPYINPPRPSNLFSRSTLVSKSSTPIGLAQPLTKKYPSKNRTKHASHQRPQQQQQQDLEDRLKRSFKPPKVLFENEKVIVIDKPAGCALQAEEPSEAWIRWQLIDQYLRSRYGKLHLVHRLDKSTSGPLILARSSPSARTLATQFKHSTIRKSYLALVQFLPTKTGPIQDAKIQGRIECRLRNRNDRMVIVESHRNGPDCKRSVTDWELVTATATHAIISLSPQTGRKHQLRLHCSRFLAAPIVGDFKYGFEYLNDQSQKAIEMFLKRDCQSRVMLHSASIEFKLYRKEEPKQVDVRVESRLPEDFRILCDQLDLCTQSIR